MFDYNHNYLYSGLINGISTSNGLFNTKIGFISKCLIIIITVHILVWLMAYQHLMDYLMPKLDSFVNISF